ncbi:MAG: hypothetical protein MJ176_03520, partial [Treponema sp.]|nr:hypothetical protein [Treponema sp.]
MENVMCISYGFKIDPKEIEIGQCITSRYYKGFSNYNPENAVIVMIEEMLEDRRQKTEDRRQKTEDRR